MPMTFPAHQGLVLPVMRRWSNSLDALALSVGAAMPDITDTILGLSINGYFKQWYGHAWVGIFTLDLWGGLVITWFLALVARYLLRFTDPSPRWRSFPGRAPKADPSGAGGRNPTQRRLRSFSVLVGILSHVGFDLISHDTNLLFYPWVENPRWFPAWWYRTWFKVRPLPMFGKSYSVGVFSIIWGMLTVLGTFFFIRFCRQKIASSNSSSETSPAC